MRYLVALIIGIGALFGVNAFADLFSMPRPWNSLAMGATVGITMVIVLLVWEVVKPSNKDAAPAKPAMSEEERAKARAERRSRLAAEAGVSLDDTDSGKGTTESKADDAETESKSAGQDDATEAKPAEGTPAAAAPPKRSVSEDEESPEADESSIEAEPENGGESRYEENTGDLGQDQPDQDEPDLRAAGEPETLAPDEYDEEATGSSLESPPTGEPGISVDALEDAESADTDGAADDDPVDDETDSTR
ncbi:MULTISPECIES: hypothetical protein [unclassified Brevibacterium]|uniref:hypothetical protein n=1 Tax=unclassified Brevibacterium TaxID=2614124 RepID=UPI0018675253|nr:MULTISPECIES: hypothetical protein [unclassified Brevibacterium]